MVALALCDLLLNVVPMDEGMIICEKSIWANIL